MNRVCAWCNTALETDVDLQLITHTICEKCRSNIRFQHGTDLQDYLNAFDFPIIAVDKEMRIVTANNIALEALGKELDGVVPHLCGEVFECAYSRLPEGCGRTIHCSGCAIRRTVTHTYQTGEACYRVPSYLTDDSPVERQIALHITTEKVGDYVFLRIDG